MISEPAYLVSWTWYGMIAPGNDEAPIAGGPPPFERHVVNMAPVVYHLPTSSRGVATLIRSALETERR